MENASKALIMAGGIFLAIVLITFGVYVYSSLHDLAETQDKKNQQQQLADFNKSYEAYNRSLMYGTELITVMNKANDNNKMYNYDEDFEITINFRFVEKFVYVYNVGTGKRVKSGEFKTGFYYNNKNYENEIKGNPETFNDFKRRLFKCQSVAYNEETGRIKSMTFEEVKLNDYTHK